MRHGWIVTAIIVGVICGGCARKRSLSSFTIKPGMKQKDFEDLYGDPMKEIPSWMAYPLEDGNELRIYFTIGPKAGGRSVGEAAVYNAMGNRIQTVFKITPPPETQPATQPAMQPAGAPATQPASP